MDCEPLCIFQEKEGRSRLFLTGKEPEPIISVGQNDEVMGYGKNGCAAVRLRYQGAPV